MQAIRSVIAGLDPQHADNSVVNFAEIYGELRLGVNEIANGVAQLTEHLVLRLALAKSNYFNGVIGDAEQDYPSPTVGECRDCLQHVLGRGRELTFEFDRLRFPLKHPSLNLDR